MTIVGILPPDFVLPINLVASATAGPGACHFDWIAPRRGNHAERTT